MRKIGVSIVLAFTLLVFMTCSFDLATANNNIKVMKNEALTAFELQNGDRVVFLGNSLFENDLKYGYIEFVLTSRWPDRDVKFRNLGWMGDTVHGDARSYYTTPPDSYDLLIQQLKDVNPTVVFIGYGANESYEGKEGVIRFKEGLNKLLDEIDEMDARAILFSPIPHMAGFNLVEGITERNKDLKLYSTVISQTASERNLHYVNLFDSFQNVKNKDVLTENGVHLNENGYYYLASVIEDQLGQTSRQFKIEINLSEKVIDIAGSASIIESQFSNNNVRFTLNNPVLPLPLPTSGKIVGNDSIQFQITGLNNKCFSLSMGTDIVASASAERWSTGVQVDQGVLFRQASELRKLIVDKNQLFFRKYRPTNRTYLIGFRSYEQGQNVNELEHLDLFISRLESQIFQLRKSSPQVFRVDEVQ